MVGQPLFLPFSRGVLSILFSFATDGVISPNDTASRGASMLDLALALQRISSIFSSVSASLLMHGALSGGDAKTSFAALLCTHGICTPARQFT